MNLQKSWTTDCVEPAGKQRSRHSVIKLAEAIRNIEEVSYDLAGTNQVNIVRNLMIIASELETIGVNAKFIEK